MATESKPGVLSEEMLKVIRGEVAPHEKREAYKDSLHSWWSEYAHRKNEEDDMVAGSLLYDERCHLPRTAPGPDWAQITKTDRETQPAEHNTAQQATAQQQQQQQQ